MIRIGRYRLAFGRMVWVQTHAPTTIRHFLCFWIFKEARPQDTNRELLLPVDPKLENEGRVYRYKRACRKAETSKERR